MKTIRRVLDIMSAPTFFVEQSTYLSEVDRVLEERNVSALAVTDHDGELVGVVSRADLIRSATGVNATRGAHMLQLPDIPVRDVMTRSPLSVTSHDALAHAATLMSGAGVHRVFVVDNGDMAGVVSVHDLMVAVHEEHISLPLHACMSRSVVSVSRTSPISAAVDEMTTARVHGLLVEDGGHPVGILSLEGLLLARHWPATFDVGEFMYPRPICLPVNMTLHRAAAIAVANEVRHVVVLDDHAVCGILTGLDFIRAYARVHAHVSDEAAS